MANEQFNTEMTIDLASSRLNDRFDVIQSQPVPPTPPVPSDKFTEFMVWCPLDNDSKHFKLALVGDSEISDFEEDLKTYAQIVEFPTVNPIFCMYIKTREEHTAAEVRQYIDQFSTARQLKLGRVDVVTTQEQQ